MYIIKNNIGLCIGILFSIISFALTFTFAIPMWSIFGGVLIEQILSSLFPSMVFATIGTITSVLLGLLLISLLYAVYRAIKVKSSSGERLLPSYVIKMMLIAYLLVHPLGFYLFLGIALDFHLDAQYLFGAVYSFPFSSLFFIVFGFLMDRTANQSKKRVVPTTKME